MDPSPRGGSGCLGLVGCLVVAAAALVTVGGFFLSGAIGVVAPNRGLDDMRAKGIENLTETPWTGTITCADGDRDAGVEFTRQRRGQTHIDARIHWLAPDGSQGGSQGHYEASGTFDGVRLRIEPDWGSRRHGGYRPVALVGSITDAQVDQEAATVNLIAMAGTVAGEEGCTAFELSR